MKDFVHELPGMERIRLRFIEMLQERQEKIAASALAAWDSKTPDDITSNLTAARAILHQIAGSAGSLGFVDLGDTARSCEDEIIAYLEGPDADSAQCPDGVIMNVDGFIAKCHHLLDTDA